MAFKLLELDADPNIITRNNETPAAIVSRKRPDDSAEQQEARDIIFNMLRHYGGQMRWQDALRRSRVPKPKPSKPEASTMLIGQDGKTQVEQQKVSATHTRFCA